MEMFMIQTGFYQIVGRKEGERRDERFAQEDEMRQRMKKLNINFDDKK